MPKTLKESLCWVALALLLADAGLAHHYAKKAPGPWWDRAVADFTEYFLWGGLLVGGLMLAFLGCYYFAEWVMREKKKKNNGAIILPRDPHGLWANRQSSWQPVIRKNYRIIT